MLQETGSQHCLAGTFGQFVALQLQPENEGQALFDCIGYFKTTISLCLPMVSESIKWLQLLLYYVAEFVKKKAHSEKSEYTLS